MNDKLLKGFVLFSRDTIDSSLWQLPPDHFRVACYLLIKARYNKRIHTLPDGTTVGRGQLVTSMILIAENCSYYENRTTREYSRKKVLNILNDLEKIGFIKRNSHRKGTHITICNYDRYQVADNYNSHTGETLGEHRGNTDGTLRNTNKHDKNVKKDKNEEVDSFPVCLSALKAEQSIANAVSAVYASHDDFAGVARFHIENVFATYTDRDLWAGAIAGMARKFAGVGMTHPTRHLENWLKYESQGPSGKVCLEDL